MLNCVGLKKVLQNKCAHLWKHATTLKNNLKYDGFTVYFLSCLKINETNLKIVDMHMW